MVTAAALLVAACGARGRRLHRSTDPVHLRTARRRLALTATFAVVALAWLEPRFDETRPGRALPPWVTSVLDAPVTRWVIAVVALAFTLWVAVAAFLGRRTPRTHCPASSTCSSG